LLTGERRTERTNASTTGMVDARTQDWSPELLAAAGVDATLFAPLIDPGEVIGLVREDIVADLTTASVPVIAVCSHDTASAVLAVPALAEGAGPLAYISSGTWSLVGIELKDPVATESARTAGFTNEGGTPGSVRFLKNVMGMWLLQESRREWAADGLDPGLIALLEDAAREEAGRWRIDATDPAFLAPGQMATRIREVARPEDGADDGPRSPAQVTRCIVDSLAVAYRDTLQEACEIAGVPWPKRLHVVGGGSRNALLNQLTADATGLDVAAGPVEATALGNVAMQAQGLGVLPEGHAALRAVVRGGVELETFRPGGQPRRAMSAG
ncbi:MAG: FGGY-family carbohydrate kinase, partial [Brachybacterium sp.]|nr:FGGY-family carbohydrate kinase [Brachybacterium sp.]